MGPTCQVHLVLLRKMGDGANICILVMWEGWWTGGANICMANTGPLHPCQLGRVFVSGLTQFALREPNRIINYSMHHKMMVCCFDSQSEKKIIFMSDFYFHLQTI